MLSLMCLYNEVSSKQLAGIKFKGEVQAREINVTVLGIVMVFETTGLEITQTVVRYRRTLSPGILPMFRDWGNEEGIAKEAEK